jgi:hypothetical protein
MLSEGAIVPDGIGVVDSDHESVVLRQFMSAFIIVEDHTLVAS